jgi:hypothetical protein
MTLWALPMLVSYALPETNVRVTVGRAPDLRQSSLHAHTWEWSGNPAVLGCYALRPVALRPRLSNGFALISAWLGLRTRPIGSHRKIALS